MATILLVDDSPTVRTIVKVYLAGQAFDFIEAGNGTEALTALQQHPVGLVIADLNMPGMDGVTFLKTLRQSTDPKLKALPVILLTGEKGEGIRDQGLEAGANAFVQKPVNPADLRQAIDSILARAA